MPAPEEDNIFYAKIYDRLYNQHKDVAVAFCGEYGSGKSVCAMSAAYYLDWYRLKLSPKEIIKERVVYDPSDLLDLVASERLPEYSAILYEEPICSFGARNWYQASNKALSRSFEVFRRWKYILLLPLQSLGKIDANIRRGRINFIVECLSIDFPAKLNVTKIKECQYNPVLDKDYIKLLRDDKGIRNPIYFPMLPQSFVDEYEELARVEKLNIVRQSSEELKGLKRKEEVKNPSQTDQEIVNKIVSDIKRYGVKSNYIRKYGNRWCVNGVTVANSYDLSERRCRTIRGKADLIVQDIKL